ncbi:MAG: SMR family transporter [Cyanobacteria bacterium J06638_22]
MALSLRPISLSIAYAIWSGIGTLGTAIIGVFCFRKPLAPGSAVGNRHDCG